MSTTSELIFVNREDHSSTNPGEGVVFYFVNSVPYFRDSSGLSTLALSSGTFSAVDQDIVDAGTAIDFTEVSNTIYGTSFDSENHCFNLLPGVYLVNFFIDIDNSNPTDKGTYRKAELTLDSETIYYDLRPDLGANQNLSIQALLTVEDATVPVAVTISHDADDDLAIGDLCYMSFVKVA